MVGSGTQGPSKTPCLSPSCQERGLLGLDAEAKGLGIGASEHRVFYQ